MANLCLLTAAGRSELVDGNLLFLFSLTLKTLMEGIQVLRVLYLQKPIYELHIFALIISEIFTKMLFRDIRGHAETL